MFIYEWDQRPSTISVRSKQIYDSRGLKFSHFVENFAVEFVLTSVIGRAGLGWFGGSCFLLGETDSTVVTGAAKPLRGGKDEDYLSISRDNWDSC
jgi:hypothetical protein